MKIIILLCTIISLFVTTIDDSKNHQEYIDSNIITISGIVKDSITKKPLLFSTVALYFDTILLKEIKTDLDGRFYFEGPKFGNYLLECSFDGYKRKIITKINLTGFGHYVIDIEMMAAKELGDSLSIIEWEKDLVFDSVYHKHKITSQMIKKLPPKDISTIESAPAKKPKLKYILLGYWRRLWR